MSQTVMSMKRLIPVALLAAVAFAAPAAHAQEQRAPKKVDWSFEGPFGTYDRGALQRGYQVYKEVCSTCHAMKHLAYRDLGALGFSEPEVRALAAQYQVTDGP